MPRFRAPQPAVWYDPTQPGSADPRTVGVRAVESGPSNRHPISNSVLRETRGYCSSSSILMKRVVSASNVAVMLRASRSGTSAPLSNSRIAVTFALSRPTGVPLRIAGILALGSAAGPAGFAGARAGARPAGGVATGRAAFEPAISKAPVAITLPPCQQATG